MQFLRSLIGCFVKKNYNGPHLASVVVQKLDQYEKCTSVKCSAGNNLFYFTLLLTNEEQYERALDSLKKFLSSKNPVRIKYVQSRDKLHNVLTDVEQNIENLRIYSDTGDEDFIPIHLLIDQGLYFCYTFGQGDVYWIPVLRTGQYGSRFPVDQRSIPVVDYDTLDSLLKHT